VEVAPRENKRMKYTHCVKNRRRQAPPARGRECATEAGEQTALGRAGALTAAAFAEEYFGRYRGCGVGDGRGHGVDGKRGAEGSQITRAQVQKRTRGVWTDGLCADEEMWWMRRAARGGDTVWCWDHTFFRSMRRRQAATCSCSGDPMFSQPFLSFSISCY
jgi:hypothetical protein